MPRDQRTKALVLRRTNYGESDRILNLITPEGKISVLARGVRKEKSRLAGAVELFTLSDVVIHQGRGRLATLTAAKMLRFYQHLLTDLRLLELASNFLKKIERAATQTDNPEFFDILDQALAGLDSGVRPDLVATWFDFNLLRATGEELNLFRDTAGEPLHSEQNYIWDESEQALRPDEQGKIGVNEIKLLRLIWSTKLKTVASIKGISKISLDFLSNLCYDGGKLS